MRRTLLVVDDTPLIRELGALFLARAGRVHTAASAEEALAMARKLRPDLVVADLRMPGMDGAELCRRLKQDPGLGGIRVIVLLASGAAAEREHAIHAGADDVLPKPIERLALLEAARRLLASRLPRGLPRIEVNAAARLRQRGADWDGIARNLSRGGVFVESARLAEPRSELELSLLLPEADELLFSTAQVIWTRDPERTQPPGMGLQFLGLDRHAARLLADYVDERLPAAAPPMRELET